MTFASRIMVSSRLEDDVESYLQRKTYKTSRNGIEHTAPAIHGMLLPIDGWPAKIIRFAPDGVAVSEDYGALHWEAKLSKSIEKDAYHAYGRLRAAGARVLIFVKAPDTGLVYWQWVQKIKFMDSHEEVAKHPPDKRFDVIDGWISPRTTGRRFSNGSGTPYKYINFHSLVECRDFYEDGG